MLLCLYIDSFFKKLTFITMFLLTVLVLGAKNLQKLPNRYRHLRLSFATYNSDWSKVSDVSEPLRNTCNIGVLIQLHKGDGPVVEEESIVLVSRCCKYDFFPRF